MFIGYNLQMFYTKYLIVYLYIEDIVDILQKFSITPFGYLRDVSNKNQISSNRYNSVTSELDAESHIQL